MAIKTSQMEQLKPFSILPCGAKAEGLPASHLLDEELCRSFLSQYMLDIKAPNQRVAASLFMKQYARITVAAALYHISLYNGFVSLPIERCLFSKDRTLHIQQDECEWIEWDCGDRETWLTEMLHPLFAEHLTPMILVLQRESKLPSKILWENVAVRINSFYRKMLTQELTPVESTQIKDDFHFLKEASGDLFQLKKNPLATFLHLETEACTRRTCCMYYLMGKNEYCGVCPLPKEAGTKVIKHNEKTNDPK
ncbi:IucA/IucC family C-terminal-domain containing protein [Alkalicoccobacillus porphyridii]|uniref:Fe-S oxidoreductase n=1 Tax=Alkalicoccobacillus porphyridii TaxID=2597270 RepID=A0A554A103_9BACI|nr:IucA/IucC family C-terminal-domain containing protein [Alkalicoccobacillus porphyridii]TSB47371.1 Fe-S oxidoreductase [Alkalicoccobacillus porphyridii]